MLHWNQFASNLAITLVLTTRRWFCYRKGIISLVHSWKLPLSCSCHIKNNFKLLHKKWRSSVSCRTWAASSSYTWSPFKTKPSLPRMRWGNNWKMCFSFFYGLRPWHLGFSLLRAWQKKQTANITIGITPVSAFLSGACVTSFFKW